jgi:hypothetical protein
MSLIRGYGGKLPCPVCLAPEDKLADISATWPPRTAAQTQQLIKEARTLNRSDSEAHLSSYGIRDVDVSLFPLL